MNYPQFNVINFSVPVEDSAIKKLYRAGWVDLLANYCHHKPPQLPEMYEQFIVGLVEAANRDHRLDVYQRLFPLILIYEFPSKVDLLLATDYRCYGPYCAPKHAPTDKVPVPPVYTYHILFRASDVQILKKDIMDGFYKCYKEGRFRGVPPFYGFTKFFYTLYAQEIHRMGADHQAAFQIEAAQRARRKYGNSVLQSSLYKAYHTPERAEIIKEYWA